MHTSAERRVVPQNVSFPFSGCLSVRFFVVRVDTCQLQIDHSLKDIPISSKQQYLKFLLEKTESFLRNVRWKVHWYENPDTSSKESRNFGFKSLTTPPYNEELNAFEQDMHDLISSIKFRDINDSFQNKLSDEVKRINETNKVIINADKTSNVYQMEQSEYLKLLNENITKHYQKAPSNMKADIDKTSSEIAKKLEVDNRVQKFTTNSAYLTLKDHKPNFIEKKPCILINPAKNQIGKISKLLLQDIIQQIQKTQPPSTLTLWRNTNELKLWFGEIDNKKKVKFITFDVVDFYPSITEDLLDRALERARNMTDIDETTVHTIKQSKNPSYLMTEPLGRKLLTGKGLTSPWGRMMVLKHVNSLACIYSTA